MADLGDLEVAFERLLDMFPLGSIGGCNADEMGRGESRCGNMKTDSFFVGPDSCALRAINILDDLVFDAGKYMFMVLVSLLAYLDANADEKRAFLLTRLANHLRHHSAVRLTSSPSAFHLSNSLPTSS